MTFMKGKGTDCSALLRKFGQAGTKCSSLQESRISREWARLGSAPHAAVRQRPEGSRAWHKHSNRSESMAAGADSHLQSLQSETWEESSRLSLCAPRPTQICFPTRFRERLLLVSRGPLFLRETERKTEA